MLSFSLAGRTDKELTALEAFLFENGANEWNYLPAEGMRHTFDLVSAGRAEILCARDAETDTGTGTGTGTGTCRGTGTGTGTCRGTGTGTGTGTCTDTGINAGKQCIGIGIYILPNALPEEWKEYANGQPAIFVAEMCVKKEHVGKGVGSKILSEIANRAVLTGTDARMLLMDRHKDNAASEGMMRRAGCVPPCVIAISLAAMLPAACAMRPVRVLEPCPSSAYTLLRCALLTSPLLPD